MLIPAMPPIFQHPANAFALMYEKFWDYPMLMVATKDEALALAKKLLLGE